MQITRRQLRRLIRETLLEATRSSPDAEQGVIGSEVKIGYPRSGFDWNDCINEIDFSPWFNYTGWEDGLVTPADLEVFGGDGSSVKLTGDGSADEKVSVAASVYAPQPRCWIERDGDKIVIGWSYVPEYSFREAERVGANWGLCTAAEAEFEMYPVLKRLSLVFQVETDTDGNEYVLDYVDGSQCEGSLWQDNACETDCCLSDICLQLLEKGYRGYSECSDCVEEADDCFGDMPDKQIPDEFRR